MDHTVHVADLVRWMLKTEFTRVYAEVDTLLHDVGIDDCGMLTADLASGAFMSLDPSWSRPDSFTTWGDVTMQVIGTKGVASLDAFRQAGMVYVATSPISPGRVFEKRVGERCRPGADRGLHRGRQGRAQRGRKRPRRPEGDGAGLGGVRVGKPRRSGGAAALRGLTHTLKNRLAGRLRRVKRGGTKTCRLPSRSHLRPPVARSSRRSPRTPRAGAGSSPAGP